MKRSRIHIENLTLRLPGSARHDPRRVAGDIGREVLTQLADAFHGQTGEQRVDKVSATMQPGRLTASGILQIAGGVASEAVKGATRRDKR